MYVPNLISILLYKIWPEQATIIKNKWLWGDNSVNILGRIMVLVQCTSSHCRLSIYQVSFQSRLYFQRYGSDRHQL